MLLEFIKDPGYTGIFVLCLSIFFTLLTAFFCGTYSNASETSVAFSVSKFALKTALVITLLLIILLTNQIYKGKMCLASSAPQPRLY